MWYLGRSVRHVLKEVITTQGSAERTEVSRGHSQALIKSGHMETMEEAKDEDTKSN